MGADGKDLEECNVESSADFNCRDKLGVDLVVQVAGLGS